MTTNVPTPAPGFIGRIDTLSVDCAPGRYLTTCTVADFFAFARANDLPVSCAYNYPGPSRVLYAYDYPGAVRIPGKVWANGHPEYRIAPDAACHRSFAIRAFEDGGLNWFTVETS